MAKYEMTDQGLGRRVLITGASAGIGRDLAKIFAQNGFDVVLTARRRERLEQLAEELRKKFETKSIIIPADLSDPETPKRIFGQTEGQGLDIDGLVNNAGFGLPGYFVNTTWEDQARSIQVMVTAAAHLCHLFLPRMLERQYGRILNVASMAGLLPSSPGMSLYGAQKSFLVQFSETLWAETKGRSVNVTALCPGFTYSEFYDIAHARDQANRTPHWLWMDAETVARQGYNAVMEGKPLEIAGGVNKSIAVASKFMPHRVALNLFASRTRRIRREGQ